MSESNDPKPRHGDPGCTCTTCHVAKRRSHKKSRNGCKSCKRRRIKCDEVKPSCGQCVKALIPCDYLTSATTSDPPTKSGGSPEANVVLTSRKRGRPRKDLDSIFQRPSPPYINTVAPEVPDAMSTYSTPSSMSIVPDSSQALPNPTWVWTVEDMELQHHYMISEDLCPHGSCLWRERVPRLAFSNHCVLHLLLAVSALHLARERPDEANRYKIIADSHYTIGLRQVMDILPNLNRDNCGALYIASTLVCSYSFAQRHSPGHLLIISDGEEVAWFELLKGVRLVVDTMGFDAIFSGVLGPFTNEPEREPLCRKADRVVWWQPALNRISDLIPSTGADARIFEKMLDGVSSAFEETFGTAEQPKRAIDGRMEVIVGCIYRTEDEFVQCLKDKKPVALLILAHLVVLFKTLEWIWYMKGWATHILHGVALMLGSDYREYLRWPREEIERLGEERNQK
ncbi:uncharacterized protein CTRU02_202991 [Colletotrichum truncatum]|uniref:Uncharacterized protein n=1 Tax=Colletotrichum truncatum TaxID=5467 RepID=A0ACC3Z832_COLTU|nr:uncharacterized protein CTRU02_13188 [Colletotrichum truncatum]KAF6783680.1 hypothetical protein CTRU02_13188 [Colletotrichum truncatum]